MKLRSKFAIVLLLVTIVLSGTVYGGLELYKDRMVERTQDDVNETATLTTRQLDAAVEDHEDFVGYVASRPGAARFARSDQFLEQFVDNSRFFAAQVVDANGTIVDFHGDVTQDVRQESVGEDVGDRPYVSNALSGEVYVSEAEYVNATGRYLVIVSAPIFEDRRPKGALAAAIYLDGQSIFGVLAPISTENQRVSVTADSMTLYRSGDRLHNPIEASRTVESTGWVVTVERDRAGLLTRLRGLAVVQGAGILLIVLSAVSFGVWEYRTTLAQTEKLLAGFDALQRGEFGHELSLAAAEEWRQISRGFNALASGLATRESKLHQREQRLQVLNRVLRHNLRNSAAIVLGHAEVVRRRSEKPVVVASAERIEGAGRGLEALSRKAQQLAYTIEDREPIVLNVSSLVEEVVSDLRPAYPDVEIDATIPPGFRVRADPALRTAIENVCENACEHNDSSDPRLDVSIEGDDDRVTLRVSDNGGGIPEHEWSVVEAGEETPLHHGSGLGLWIARWAIEQSDGTLDFEVDDDVGSTVVIELVRDPDDDGTEEDTNAGTGAGTSP